METNTTINNLNSSKTPRKKMGGLSAKTLGKLALTGSLLFYACSNNNTSPYEQNINEIQQLKHGINTQQDKIHKDSRKIAHIDGKRNSLNKSYESVATQYQKKRAECIELAKQQPIPTERLTNKIRSAQQLYNRAIQLDLEIKKLEDKQDKTYNKLIHNIAEKDGLIAELQVVQNHLNNDELLALLPQLLPNLDPKAHQ